MQNNIPVIVRPFSSRGDQTLSLAGLTSTSFLEEETLDSFDMLLVIITARGRITKRRWMCSEPAKMLSGAV